MKERKTPTNIKLRTMQTTKNTQQQADFYSLSPIYYACTTTKWLSIINKPQARNRNKWKTRLNSKCWFAATWNCNRVACLFIRTTFDGVVVVAATDVVWIVILSASQTKYNIDGNMFSVNRWQCIFILCANANAINIDAISMALPLPLLCCQCEFIVACDRETGKKRKIRRKRFQ